MILNICSTHSAPPPNRYAGTIFNKHPGNLTLVRPLLTFHKRGLPGQFLAVQHGTRRDPGQVQSIFFTPRGPRVTFNSSLKVIRAPARNIPRFKPVICLAWARRGPCRDPPGTRGQFLKKSTQDTRPSPLRDPGGSLWGPDLACRGPGRCSAGAFTMSERVPVGTLL